MVVRQTLKDQIIKILFIPLFLSIFNQAHALTESEIEAQVMKAVTDRHPTYGEAWWRALGNATPVIIRLHRSTSDAFIKLNLLQGLSWYDDPGALEYLKSVATEQENKVTRNAALRSIGLSPRAGDAVEFLGEFLEHENPHTRLEAAKALTSVASRFSDPRAKELLAGHQEPTGWVRAKLSGNPLEHFKKRHSPSKLKQPTFSPHFEGTWQGQMIWENQSGKLESTPVTITLKRVNDGTLLKGRLKSKLIECQLETEKGAGSQASLMLGEVSLKHQSAKHLIKAFSRGLIALEEKQSSSAHHDYLSVDLQSLPRVKAWLKKK